MFEHSIEIAASPAAVFAVWTDVTRWPEWTRSVTSIEMVGDLPLQIGAKVRIRQPRLGTTTWTISEFEPDQAFTWVSSAPGLAGQATHRVQQTPTGTRATMSVDHTGFLAPIARALTAGITRRYLTYEAEGLKARAESGE
ncbi:MAG: SRPBCC family protein [Microthrixaceae bacterium]|nr:SRPBCC family protein [Microthrixaceae bacterium]MCO5311755.1 SRPBCC family protein [Microthrixaceae bacterium]